MTEREEALAKAQAESAFLLKRIEKETLAFIAAELAQPDRPKSEQYLIAELDAPVMPVKNRRGHLRLLK